MRTLRLPQIAGLALAALLWAAPARAIELYLAGDLGISWISGEGVGVNDVVGSVNPGESDDASPVWGGSLGVMFPLNAALPWRVRVPEFDVPYWPGQELHVDGTDGVGFPDWSVRAEVEYLNGRDADLTTPSFTPLDAYRVHVEAWTLMGNARLDVPIRTPVRAVFGRVPFLDPVTLYGGAGAGIGYTDLEVSTGLLSGKQNDRQQFTWQGFAGVGYDLTERVKLSLGWRYVSLGEAKTQLFDSTQTNRGRYAIDFYAHEFNASISVWFYRLPPLLGDE